MANESDSWVQRTAATCRAVSGGRADDASRRRLLTYLDLTATARVEEVGVDRMLEDLRAVLHSL